MANEVEVIRVSPLLKDAFDLLLADEKVRHGRVPTQSEVFEKLLRTAYPEYIQKAEALRAAK